MKFIREYYPHLILIPGLGENQTTTGLRLTSHAKGYRSGQPDLIRLNKHKNYNGLVIELKSPSGKGRLSEEQESFLKGMEQSNCLTLVSDKYEQVMMTIVNYSKDILYKCELSGKWFPSIERLERHQRLMITGEAMTDNADET